ncbi:TonB-dependent receptor [Desulfosarcina sp. OttesenSCG-928-A07]|nr:TonB-dependent receptor [Desulfosarcina sp. OttesenSCG-928-G17]MDL2328314.1 TonB-dependent receptor [Desulfosarcina sp. OttesenSCG-928-A07]
MNKILAKCLTFSVLLSFGFGWVPLLAQGESEAQTSSQPQARVQNTQSPPAMELDSIIVTATRVERTLDELPISLSVVSEEDVRRNPSVTIADQISSVPGVMVDNQTPGIKKVNIRGMSSSRVVVLINGVKQPELRLAADGAPIGVDPSQIERIEVIKGPASVLYGSDAIGGVINIITKKGGDKPFSFSQNFLYDSSNEGYGWQSAIFGDFQGFNYRLSYGGFNADDIRVPDSVADGRLLNTDYDKRNYSGILGYSWDGGEISFSSDRHKVTDMGHVLRWNNPATGELEPATWDEARPYTTSNPEVQRDTHTVNLGLTELNDYLAKLNFTAYVQELNRETQGIGIKNEGGYANGVVYSYEEHVQDSYGGTFQSDWRLGDDHYVILGLDYDKSKYDSDISAFNRLSGVRTGRNFGHGRQESYGYFLQHEWQITEDLSSTLGLRWTEVKTVLSKETSKPQNVGSTKDSKMVGNLGLVYSGFEDFELRALYSQGFRTPNLLQLFIGSSAWMEPNPDLKPESSQNFELGLRYHRAGWNVDLGLFYSILKDAMASRIIGYSGSNALRQYQNLEEVVTYGAELGLDYTFENLNLTPYLSGTWLRYISEDQFGFKARHVDGRPEFWGKTGLKWEVPLTDDLQFYSDLNLMLTGRSYQSNADGVDTDHMPGYGVLNLNFGFEGGQEHKYNISVSLNNIGNKEYRLPLSSLNYEPGFNVVLGVGFEY